MYQGGKRIKNISKNDQKRVKNDHFRGERKKVVEISVI